MTRADLKVEYKRVFPNKPLPRTTAEMRTELYRDAFPAGLAREDTPGKFSAESMTQEGDPKLSRRTSKRQKSTLVTKPRGSQHATPDALDRDNLLLCSEGFIWDFENFIRESRKNVSFEPHFHRLNLSRLTMRFSAPNSAGRQRLTIYCSRSRTIDGVKASLVVWRSALALLAEGMFVPQALRFLRLIGVRTKELRSPAAGTIGEERILRDCVIIVAKFIEREGETYFTRIQKKMAALDEALKIITDARYDAGKFACSYLSVAFLSVLCHVFCLLIVMFRSSVCSMPAIRKLFHLLRCSFSLPFDFSFSLWFHGLVFWPACHRFRYCVF